MPGAGIEPALSDIGCKRKISPSTLRQLKGDKVMKHPTLEDAGYYDEDREIGQCAKCGCPISNEFGLCKSCDYELSLEREAELLEFDKPPNKEEG